MSTPGVHYTAWPDATPESEAAVLASVYSFILGSLEKEKAAGPVSRFVDQKEVSDVEHEASTAKNLT